MEELGVGMCGPETRQQYWLISGPQICTCGPIQEKQLSAMDEIVSNQSGLSTCSLAFDALLSTIYIL